jgi:hypothetical protein
MVARAALIARVVSGQRAFVLAEDRLDRRVHVQVDKRPSLGAHRLQTVRRQDLFQCADRRLVEAPQVPVERVQAGHDPAGQVHEQRVGRQRFDAEHAMLTDRRRVHQQPHLRFHRVDDHRTGLEVSELIAQRLVNAEIANERAEPGETAVAGQPRVCLPGVDITGVSATDSARSALAISALASERISTHLLGARRGCF